MYPLLIKKNKKYTFTNTLSQTFLAFGSRAGTSKELFESNLLAGVLNMWRRHYEEVLFGNIVNHIAELYDVGNDA